MAAIRRSFSGALQRRRSASMTPEQKTEETKLERLTERFERGMRNLKTLEARLITVSGAARNFKTALADLGMSPLEDANGWPRGPTDVDVALVNADEHGIVGRIASACCAPLRRLVAEGNELRLLCKRRRDLVADRDHRKQKLQQIEKACERAKDPEKIRGQVTEASQKYVAAVDAADRATGHCTVALDAFDLAVQAEESATLRAVAGARLAHAERAASSLEPVVRRAFPGTATNHFEALLARCSMNDDERLQETRGFARALERARNDAAQKTEAVVPYATPQAGRLISATALNRRRSSNSSGDDRAAPIRRRSSSMSSVDTTKRPAAKAPVQWAYADQASPQSAEERRALVVLARAPRMPAAPPAPVRPGHVVYHAFAASYDWQVSVGLGEAVEVLETHEDGWSTVSTLGGKRGMVPKGYLRPLGAPAAESGEDTAAASATAPASEFAVWSGDPDEIVAAAPPSDVKRAAAVAPPVASPDVKRVSESPPKPPPPPPIAASPDIKRVSPDATSPDIRRVPPRVVTASPDVTSAPAASPKKKPPPPPKASPRKPPPPATPSPRQLKPPPPPLDAPSPDVKQIQKASPRDSLGRPPPPPAGPLRSFSSPRDAKGRPPPPPKSHRRQLSEGSMGSMNSSRLSHESALFENN